MHIRRTVNELDASLSQLLTMRTIYSIAGVMINIYIFTIHKSMNHITVFSYNCLLTAIIITIEICVSSLICGSTHSKTRQVHTVLDDLTDRTDLSDHNLNQWIVWKNVSADSTIGFTIGGFAPINKQTLIAVSIELASEMSKEG